MIWRYIVVKDPPIQKVAPQIMNPPLPPRLLSFLWIFAKLTGGAQFRQIAVFATLPVLKFDKLKGSRKDYIASSARLALKNLGGHRRLVESRRSGFKDGLFSFYGHLSFYSLRFSLLDLRTAHNMVVAASLLF